MAKPIQLTAYIDYLCPYAHRGQKWLDEVVRQRPEVKVEYKHFALEQINNTDPNWKVWEQPEDYQGKGRHKALLAFWAADAAKRQGEAAYTRFRQALFDARHERGADNRLDFADRAALRGVAERAELDMAQFDRDFQDRGLLDQLRADHEESTEQYHAFGVPTYVFPNGERIFVKFQTVPQGQEALDVFDDVVKTTIDRPYLVEIKRPS